MAEEVRKLSVTVTIDEEGRVGVQAPSNVPIAYIVGMLEFGKQLVMNPPTDEPEPGPEPESEILQ